MELVSDSKFDVDILKPRLGEQFFVYDNFCHIKANTEAFQQMYLSHKNWPFSSSTRANKNCPIKIARVNWASGVTLALI